MVDNRSAGILGVGGGFNFKSGDISGTAAKTSDDKMGQGGEYFSQGRGEQNEEGKEEDFKDESNKLRATLNSLAVMNSANIRLRRSLDKKKNELKKSKKRVSKKGLAISENDFEKKENNQ